jgi:Squalene-hopene cyclase C-terminal domain
MTDSSSDSMIGQKRPWWETVRGRFFSSFFLSGLLHATVLVCLALVYFYQPTDGIPGLVVTTDESIKLESNEQLQPELDDPTLRDWEQGELFLDAPVAITPETESAGRDQTEPVPSSDAPLGVRRSDLAQPVKSGGQGRLAGRSRVNRAALVLQRGGTQASEAAVERGLRWLAAQQQKNGGWSFVPNDPDGLNYKNPGRTPRTAAATGLALLPFLGAGYTQKTGPYRELVEKGLYYLQTRASTDEHGTRIQDDSKKPMYSQGICALVLCEAYQMTGDESLRGVAQGAIDYIVYAQDKRGGGWRYHHGDPGDTTVTGWQVMALKSAEAAGLNVPSPCFQGVSRFLNSVQSDRGAQYGYMNTAARPTTTAVGLLLRMYTGWPREHIGLRRGVNLLSKWRPSPTDLYYDYYATQVMSHYGGTKWERWNKAMRDYLIKTQATGQLEAGSWYFPDRHGDVGGRLYNTAAAVMTLEIYYRYMPIYTDRPLKLQ